MKIETVKIQGQAYLVNGTTVVPQNANNRHFAAIQQWLAAGNEAEAEFTDAEQLAQQVTLAQSECTRRINAQWNSTGQLNAALGVYSETENAACAACITSHRAALALLVEHDGLLALDVTSDQHWPE